jgi:hypothetical protein
MFKEMATFVFFVMTGYKFRPASNNPYFAVSTDDDMDEVRQLTVCEAPVRSQIRIHMECGSLDSIVVDPDPMDP